MRESNNFRDYYDIIKKISEGSFSSIYEAKDKITNERRAIKLFTRNKEVETIMSDINEVNQEQNQYMNIIKYMKILEGKNKENNNTLKLYEYFYSEKEFAIVMEIFDSNLEQFLKSRKEPFSSEEIYNILNQLNNSFKIMSENRIVHRDIKLRNIVIKFENNEKNIYTVKLSNYSTSQILKPNENLKVYVGSKVYMSPEVLRNNEPYNEKCDLWSLGISIYELLFGTYILNRENLNTIENPDLEDLIKRLLIPEQNERISWKEYFEHPFFKNKGNNYSSIDYLKNQLINEKKINENLSIKIKELENLLYQEKNNNNILKQNINELIKQLNNNNMSKEKININENFDLKEDLNKIILKQDNLIKELKLKLSRFPFELNDGERIMSLNFKSVDKKILNFSIICKNTDVFKNIEIKLYNKFPQYYITDNYFTVCANKINKNLTLEENNIQDNDVILLNVKDI